VNQSHGESEIWVMNSDGTNQVRWGFDDFLPAWSPPLVVSKSFLFPSVMGRTKIYVMHADGTGQKNLTHSSVD